MFCTALVILALAGCGQAGPVVKPRTAATQTSQQPVVTPSPATVASPQQLIIAKIGLDAPVVGLGPDANGAMQAPRGKPANDPIWTQVYWWNVGATPGQVGNAVIAGHINRSDGSPSTFTSLDRLVVGDSIQIVDVSGVTRTFVVMEKRAVSAYASGGNDPIINDIFGPALTANLNLLTCWGKWDGKQYNQRLLVRAVLQK
jgi:predicted small lipoprotein YifL